ncbi:pilus assembly protein TadG-related protein [Salinarimonas soli]|uniref:Putative Flp pilus-assembly TadG-like N-terminal domain-containing protein n=1 Tax=Salinarimonas soli TaxID=1638099 RepID=A0A5B2V870_9HYPH|nr:pilus assembly protein TadG-related protein [Salinarimonas soli]KAA2234948.1 hypothetical protein F0L46_21640 [Salinarimonas soli]
MPRPAPLPPSGHLARLARALLALAGHRGGGVLLPVALVLPVLVGFAMLVVDGGRFMNLHASVQSGADALALAAAAELDRRPDSIQRADRAIATLVRNDQRFGQGTGRIDAGAVDVRYLWSLPARDSDPITAALTTTDPTQAGFVEVRVRPYTLSPVFVGAAGFTGATPQAGATAVGGFEQGVCNFTPFFLCNPFEGSATSIFDAIRDASFRGRLFKLKDKGGGNQYFPGNYGFLEPPGGKGADEVRDMLAIDRPQACFRQSGVELRTGNIASVAEAFNTRFDIYEGAFGGVRANASYRPAANVRKGYSGAACSQVIAYDPTERLIGQNGAKGLGLPRDNCFLMGNPSGKCPTVLAAMEDRIGDGKWDCRAYWRGNYGGNPPLINGKTCSDNSNAVSRYEVYRYEIDQNLLATSSPIGERGTPICYAGDRTALNSSSLDRRLITAAILDCGSLGPVSGSSGGPYPVTAFARFFLTEPMDKQTGEVWAELVDIIEPGTPGAREILRDIVQLYR